MRALSLALSLLVVACTANSTAQTPTPASERSAPAAAAPCAAPLAPLRSVTATVELLPHQIGTQVVFGLDGAYVGSASAYPLGASRHWWELDAAGAKIRDVDEPR